MNLPRGSIMVIAAAMTLMQDVGPARCAETSLVPSRAVLEDRAARRFPQPVRTGDLAGRKLLGPSESQPLLGRVAGLVRGPDGRALIVVRLAGWFWQREHDVAIPVEAVGLLGEHVALLDVAAEGLRELPPFDPATEAEVAPDERIRIGLAKPFH